MTAPSVPTAEEFAKARALIDSQTVEARWSKEYRVVSLVDLAALRSTLASAEAAIERLAKEAARWRAVRWSIADTPWGELPYALAELSPADEMYSSLESLDKIADHIVRLHAAGVSPPESEKP